MTTNKHLIDKADEMAKAIDKLTDGLCKDGVALDGFTDAIRVRTEWQRLKFKRTVELFCNRSKSATQTPTI